MFRPTAKNCRKLIALALIAFAIVAFAITRLTTLNGDIKWQDFSDTGSNNT